VKLQRCLYARHFHSGAAEVIQRRPLNAGHLPLTRPRAPRFQHESLSYHWDTIPPSLDQLIHATKFFNKQVPKFLWSAEKFKTMDYGSSPEICFLGRSNVGKSSLLNALLLRRIAHTSSKPGRTRLMNAFAVGPEDDLQKRLVVLDMPGYGKGGRSEWGVQIMKYLEKRKELKRAFLLIDAEHGVKVGDRHIISLLKQNNVPFQIVLAKADKIVFPGSRTPSPGALEARLLKLRETMDTVKQIIQPDIEEEGGAVGEIIACSSEKWIDGKRMGIDAVRFAMLRAAGLELRARITTSKPVDIVSHEELFGMRGQGRD